MPITPQDRAALIREKYQGDAAASGLAKDFERLEQGEPLAYVIGNIPFLGLSIDLGSHPLIPRPETEWWTEEMIAALPPTPRVLDLCAGSGAIGLAVLKHVPGAHVSLSELMPVHAEFIRKNLEANGLDVSRADIRSGDLFAPFASETFDIIATNPPYIPTDRTLSPSVTEFEPTEALFSGKDGMDLIRRIANEARTYLAKGGTLWMECDVDNIQAARELLLAQGFTEAKIRTDPYGRERLIVAHL